MSAPRVFISLNAVRRPPARAVVTVGVFDGVHLAHQQIVHSTIRLAHRLKGTSVVLTFHPDPHAVLDPTHAPPALMPLTARVASLCALGVDWVWVIPFTKRFARMSAEVFLRQVLIERLRAVALVVGETFVFGRNRRGDLELLQGLGPRHGMRVIPVPPITRAGEPVSSSRIRWLIGQGKLALARRLLGRPPELYGEVVQGAGRGRALGIPTANLRFASQVLPPRGVYAVLVKTVGPRGLWGESRRGPAASGHSGSLIGHMRHHPSAHRGLMNLGIRPTFGPGPLVGEVHLLGFSGSLRGCSVTLSLLARLRGERRFRNPDALVRHIRKDLVRARRFF